jgi:hypothetical protein
MMWEKNNSTSKCSAGDVAQRPFMASKSWNHRAGHIDGWDGRGLSFCFGNDVKAKHLFCLFPGKQNKVQSLDTVLYTGAGHYSKEKEVRTNG